MLLRGFTIGYLGLATLGGCTADVAPLDASEAEKYSPRSGPNIDRVTVDGATFDPYEVALPGARGLRLEQAGSMSFTERAVGIGVPYFPQATENHLLSECLGRGYAHCEVMVDELHASEALAPSWAYRVSGRAHWSGSGLLTNVEVYTGRPAQSFTAAEVALWSCEEASGTQEGCTLVFHRGSHAVVYRVAD